MQESANTISRQAQDYMMGDILILDGSPSSKLYTCNEENKYPVSSNP